jgi:hypothetical protein
MSVSFSQTGKNSKYEKESKEFKEYEEFKEPATDSVELLSYSDLGGGLLLRFGGSAALSTP